MRLGSIGTAPARTVARLPAVERRRRTVGPAVAGAETCSGVALGRESARRCTTFGLDEPTTGAAPSDAAGSEPPSAATPASLAGSGVVTVSVAVGSDAEVVTIGSGEVDSIVVESTVVVGAGLAESAGGDGSAAGGGTSWIAVGGAGASPG
jgi:hypothetical protein